jgi:hypothetical protein
VKKLLYIGYLLLITFVVLEVGVRVLTKPNKAHVDMFLAAKHRYLLPLPTAANYYYEESIAETETDSYRTFDDTLGWSHTPWGWDTANFPCYANNRGMRIGRPAFERKDTALRHYHIVTIGNSFTHGDAVAAEETWSYLLEQKLGKSVGNLGVGGYGLQQALLRLMHSGITADTVLFGAIWGDFERALEPVYTFYQGGNKTRPVFDFQNDGTYHLINVPVMRPEEFYAAKAEHSAPIFQHIPGYSMAVFSDALWTKSYFLRLVVSFFHQKKSYQEKPIFLTEGDDLEHCMRIFQLFYDFCEERGMYAKIVLLDTGQNFYHKEKWGLNNPWDLVKRKLTERGIPHVDFHETLYDSYTEMRENVIHPVENLHYSPAGNLLVANLLSQNLISH